MIGGRHVDGMDPMSDLAVSLALRSIGLVRVSSVTEGVIDSVLDTYRLCACEDSWLSMSPGSFEIL